MASHDQTDHHAGEDKGPRVKAAVNTEAAKEKAQTAKDHAIEGKEKTAGFLQQTGEKATNATRGAAEAVKSTLGIGHDDKDKETNAAERDAGATKE
ncbi:late embryogenesis abundant protein 1-like [Phalaenopsis equestris]|uniref:late embryogenesis abundant protein 1-like n=1 Tax=Phalaenopsis equestris TaxID=78828 RepID=UPI0009E1F4F3|nr:late embryogenesis abundant protein 1-like [Phalaenopsis equestris]